MGGAVYVQTNEPDAHLSDDERYRWLNDRVCGAAGEVRETDGSFDVVLEVSELVWEPVSEAAIRLGSIGASRFRGSRRRLP